MSSITMVRGLNGKNIHAIVISPASTVAAAWPLPRRKAQRKFDMGSWPGRSIGSVAAGKTCWASCPSYTQSRGRTDFNIVDPA